MNFFLKYEVNLDNDKLEFEIAKNYYIVSKGTNKQTIKYRNKKVVSLFNSYNTFIAVEKSLKDFYCQSMISRTTILFSTKYEEILKASDYEDAIILIDIMQQILNYYDKIFFDEEMIFNFFINAKALVLVVLPNSSSNRNLFKNYIYNY
jgi:hypothetical protein